jgi:hypothetical protein
MKYIANKVNSMAVTDALNRALNKRTPISSIPLLVKADAKKLKQLQKNEINFFLYR